MYYTCSWRKFGGCTVQNHNILLNYIKTLVFFMGESAQDFVNLWPWLNAILIQFMVSLYFQDDSRVPLGVNVFFCCKLPVATYYSLLAVLDCTVYMQFSGLPYMHFAVFMNLSSNRSTSVRFGLVWLCFKCWWRDSTVLQLVCGVDT